VIRKYTNYFCERLLSIFGGMLLIFLLLGTEQGYAEEWQYKVTLDLITTEKIELSQTTLDSYEDDPETVEKIVPFPNIKAELKDSESESMWYWGNVGPKMNAGRKQDTGIGRFHLDLKLGLPLQQDQWQNPFLLGESRKKTGLITSEQKLVYSSGKHFGVVFGIQQTLLHYQKDTTPELNSDLGRNGARLIREAGLNLAILRFAFLDIETNVKGEADSNQGTGVRAMLAIPLNGKKLLLIFRGQREELEYNKIHPIFQTIREDQIELLIARLQADFNSFLLIVTRIHHKVESNIPFFNQEMNMLSLGIQLKF